MPFCIRLMQIDKSADASCSFRGSLYVLFFAINLQSCSCFNFVAFAESPEMLSKQFRVLLPSAGCMGAQICEDVPVATKACLQPSLLQVVVMLQIWKSATLQSTDASNSKGRMSTCRSASTYPCLLADWHRKLWSGAARTKKGSSVRAE